MARNIPNSFDRVFGQPQHAQANQDEPPRVHELFTAHLRGEISLPEFSEALFSTHGIEMTRAAFHLLQGTDAKSGQLSFQQFQKALQDWSEPEGGAGGAMIIKDQAGSIIHDNCGAPSPLIPPSQTGAARPSTDISKDPFIKAQVKLERAAAKGPFQGNPVWKTNNVSRGNPLCQPMDLGERAAPGTEEGPREMANTATRMFVGGELSRENYEVALMKIGIQLGGDSKIMQLINAHDKVGDGNFSQFMRAINKEAVLA